MILSIYTMVVYIKMYVVYIHDRFVLLNLGQHCAHKNLYNMPLQTADIVIVYIEFTCFGTRPSGT